MPERPILAVIPLPARLEVAGAVLGALATAWEEHHDQVLTMDHAAEESTPWGRALVIREPAPISIALHPPTRPEQAATEEADRG
jgi:hypothetical protein